MTQQCQQFVARSRFGVEPRADPGSQRNQILVTQQLQQPAVSGEDHR